VRAYAANTLLQEMRSAGRGSDLAGRLDDCLSTKLVGMLRFRRDHFAAAMHGARHAGPFLAHSVKQQRHADAIARRIVQLGSEPTFSPAVLPTRSLVPFEDANGLAEMAQQGHDALRATMSALAALARLVGSDAATRKLLLDIVADDQASAAELAALASALKRR
jgi:bacterioferritin